VLFIGNAAWYAAEWMRRLQSTHCSGRASAAGCVCLRLAPGHIQEVAGHANQFARADLQRLQGTSSYTARHVRCLMLAVCVVIALACIPCSQTHHSREHLLLAFGAGAPPSSCVTNNTFHANDCRCATSCCFQRMLTLAVCMLQPSPHAIHL